ncbi:16878_t:CDS:10 [Entrophospora sp. SA101]|nr:11590_t:CDS:10 [Entrophospora sp. SA101]CAJ0753440.1 16878_t:CDS:10 [Entrophospora sp. SA101]CAJ0890480.1 12105_t:CDS:10 [Entrophospora sp. SA101]
MEFSNNLINDPSNDMSKDEQIKKLNEQVKALNERIDALQEENTKLILKTSDLIDENKLKLLVTISKSIDEHLSESHTRLTWPPSTPNTNNSNIVLSSSEDEDTLVTSNNTTLKPYPHQPQLITLNSENNGAPSFGTDTTGHETTAITTNKPGHQNPFHFITSNMNANNTNRLNNQKRFINNNNNNALNNNNNNNLNNLNIRQQNNGNNNNQNNQNNQNNMNFSNRQKNNNNNYNNNNNNSNQYTLFVSWPGVISGEEEIYSLFNSDDIADIRYVQGKQFAHVDLKSQEALDEAMKLNSVINNNHINNNINNLVGQRPPQQQLHYNNNNNNNGNKPFLNNRQNNNNNNNRNNTTNGIQTQQKHKYNNNNNTGGTIYRTVSGIEELYGLFNNEDVADIRYVPGKQFAHVDLKTQEALDEALKLNSVVKYPTQVMDGWFDIDHDAVMARKLLLLICFNY